MQSLSVIFKKAYEIAVAEQPLPKPGTQEVLVQTRLSAISPGTEMLVYRGRFPAGVKADEGIGALAHEFSYPLKYGYATVGRVAALGSNVAPEWLNRLVFCFHPHESHFVVASDQLIPLPADIDPADAVFLANMETAVNFMMDGRPVIGECVVAFGQGIVGLLTTALLHRFPLNSLVTVDKYPLRREKSLQLGADCAIDADTVNLSVHLVETLRSSCGASEADLVYEVSGNPDAINQAIDVAGFAARIVIGSWYGTQKAKLDLGGHFHRRRITLISSQVSTLPQEFAARWSKARRLGVAWEMIRQIKPSQFITQRFPVNRVQEAFELLDKRPEEAIQVVLTYEH